jgi:hypothetical protein
METRNEGRGLREWDYVPLSDPTVVAKLIQNRARLDESYYALLEETSNPVISNGVFPFSEPVLVTYMDLDTLIEATPLTKAENKIVHWLMRGYGFTDIADTYGISKQSVFILLKRAAEKISKTERAIWESAYVKS